MSTQTANIDALELAVARRDNEAALTEALVILKAIEDRYGRLDQVAATMHGPDNILERAATRFAAAFGQLIVDPATPIPPIRFEQLTVQHRWIELLFSVGGFGSTDHLVPMLATGTATQKRVEGENLRRFLVLFSAAAGMEMNLEECLRVDGAGAVAGFLGYLGTRFCFTDKAHAFRETLLEWLPERLGGVKLGALVLSSVASPYMHCSYAMTPRKHDIKAIIHAQMRQLCVEAGCPEFDPAAPRKPAKRPTIVVTTEHFPEGHSVHRTHSLAVKALRRHFNVVGVIYQRHTSPAVMECFDSVITWHETLGFTEAVKATATQIRDLDPDMVLHLGVGMAPFVIALASLRLAPHQACSFGHTATTRSPVVDYMILPDDFVGDPACFSEELVLLPAHAMPYLPRNDLDYAAVRKAAEAEKAARAPDAPVRIAVPASAMKLGPPLFDALARIAAQASRPVEFQTFPLGCTGLGYAELKRRLAGRLPMAVVNEELPYDGYMAKLAACDFFLCPFPYGNMNSIIDAVLLGLPGVCLDGPEAHAHADAAYFKRMGFPKALTTQSVDEYVAEAVRLVDDPKRLARASKVAGAVDLDAIFFTGEPALFADAVLALVQRQLAEPQLAELV